MFEKENDYVTNKKMYLDNKDYILKRFAYSDIVRGELITSYSIEVTDEHDYPDKGYTDYHFETNSYYYDVGKYRQVIRKNDDGEILSYSCNCNNFRDTSSCVHLVGCFHNYAFLIFYAKPDPLKISNNILDILSKTNKPVVKKEVFLSVDILSSSTDFLYDVKIKIGINKMYSYNNKQNQFLQASNRKDDEFTFGKDFTFNFNSNYFSKKATKVLKYINRFHPDLNKNWFDDKEINNFLDLLKELDYPFTYNLHKITKILEEFPLQSTVEEMDQDNYIVNFDLKDYKLISYNYAYNNSNVYYLSDKEISLLFLLYKQNMSSLIIPKNRLKDFSSGVLPIIKKHVEVNENLKDKIQIINEPDVSLYFDLNKDNVICNIKLKYNEEIDYFDNKANVLRDVEFETNLISYLETFGFIKNNKKIIMNDLDKIVYLIDEGLNLISKKYPVYTTENFKKLGLKKTKVSSTFSVGKDNILSYDFNLDGISNDDIVNIFKSIKEKKKYYKLSNNQIVDLEDSDLNELMDLTEELDITDEDIISAKGSVMKYRAIYLDSIKDSKYSIVKTDNLFKEFINNFHQYKDANLTLADNELKTLRDYQITGVKWLYNLDKCSFGGILADEMGLGKTIQLIYYIKQMLKEDNSFKFLIVVPTSLLYNWDREFEKFAPDIPVKIVSGIKTKRQDLIENTNKNVFITTYGLLREDLEYYEKIHYHAVILDEAQNIKNPLAGTTKACKSMKADVKFALTGTPIENSAVELWSIFDYIMPGYLSKYDKFTSKYKVKEFDEDTNKLLDSLSKQISPFILRRKKKDVIKELPEKIETNIFIELGDEQKKIYVAELNKVKEAIEEALNDGGMSKVRFMILPLLTKLRQICIDPKIVYSDYTSGSNKIDRFLSVIEEVTNNNHKVLVFTSFRTALNLVKEKLDSIGIKSYQIDGSVSSKERQTRVDNFNNNDDVKVFLIMLKSGGTGLNLASADIVIHLDLWWNPQAENQATDRAHRIGQKNTVEVIKLVSKGTIEEKVLDLQEKKKELSNRLIDSNNMDQNIISELTEKDIKNLLAFENKD